MADLYLLEDGSGNYQLEDASGDLQLETDAAAPVLLFVATDMETPTDIADMRG